MSHAPNRLTRPDPVRRPGRTPDARRRAALALLVGGALGLGGCAGGVEGVLSRLPDKGDVGPVADDGSPLSARVQEALAASPATMHERIHVRAMQAGRVRLVGSVSSSGAASEAVRLADAVPGVTNVVNTLNVR